MSAPPENSAPAKKQRQRRRRTNTATSSHATLPVCSSSSQPSRVEALLAALSVAQSSSKTQPQLPSTPTSAGQKTTPHSSKQPRRVKQSVASRVVRSMKQHDYVAPTPETARDKERDYYAQKQRHNQHRIPEEVLDDLCFRFLLNIPDNEKRDETRVCFQVELAHWFYVDFYCKQEQREDCPDVNMREFLNQIFAHCDYLKPHAKRSDEIVDSWRLYKSTVPTYGAILLDSTLNYVLLVQGYYASKNSWGFPKGKVNEKEHPRACAVREVFEETGFDFGEHSKGREHKIQKFLNDTMIRLYIIPDVPTEYPFSPKTRCEIRQMQWFSVWELPTDRNDKVGKGNGSNFYTVIPFVHDLQNYIRREQQRRKANVSEKDVPSHTHTYLRTENKTSAFTPVVPKKPEEKLNSILDSLFDKDCQPSTSRSPHSPQETLFRPLTSDNTSLVQMLSNSANLSSSQCRSSGVLAAPVPIQPPSARPVYVAPKETPQARSKKKIITVPIPVACNDNAGPSTSWASTMESFSASELELELQKLLFSGTDSDGEKTPQASEDGSIFDIVPNNGTSENILVDEYPTVQLCSAWEQFKLNRQELMS